jgi:hypothetical protein
MPSLSSTRANLIVESSYKNTIKIVVEKNIQIYCSINYAGYNTKTIHAKRLNSFVEAAATRISDSTYTSSSTTCIINSKRISNMRLLSDCISG